MNKYLCSILSLVVTLFFVSCSSSVPPMQKDFADAVTNINQVDPYYRAYFRAQNGSNYTLADQRRAYLAAMQTARTPVRASDYSRGVAERNSRLATRRTSKASHSRRAVASRKAMRGGKKAGSRRAVASRKAGKGKKNVSRRAVARRGSKGRRRG